MPPGMPILMPNGMASMGMGMGGSFNATYPYFPASPGQQQPGNPYMQQHMQAQAAAQQQAEGGGAKGGEEDKASRRRASRQSSRQSSDRGGPPHTALP